MANLVGQTFEGVLVTPIVMEVDNEKNFSRSLVGFPKGTRVLLALDTTLPPVTNAEEDGKQLRELFQYLASGGK